VSAAGAAAAKAGAPLRVAFTTLGCKVNQYDTATMETFVGRDGCEVVPFARGADVYVVNTCTVTDRADAESRRLARRAKRFNPNARVILTGCYAQTSGDEAAAVDGVDYVVGIGRLPDVLRAVRGAIRADEGRVLVDNLRKERQVRTLGAEVFSGQTRAFLKVQEGCDLFCTFCIVPFSRGASRSVEPRRVLDELERLHATGFREVVLTGVHLGGYGRDLDMRLDLGDLVEMIVEHARVPRVRLSSIDPPEVTPRLLKLMADSDVLCPHIHMPIQSGSDPVLQRMRRQYDSQMVRDVTAEIRRALPDAALGTDVIAGFPGESEKEFERGYALLQEMSITHFHVFPYSVRSGTTAAKASDQVDPSRRAARARALRTLGEKKACSFTESFIDRDLSVLVETKRDPRTEQLVGYSRNYVRVLVDGPDAWMNREVQVRGTFVRDHRLQAEITQNKLAPNLRLSAPSANIQRS
jgi:threonylcarbamoyladenosine tRNA methylthiotransferase MtaB